MAKDGEEVSHEDTKATKRPGIEPLGREEEGGSGEVRTGTSSLRSELVTRNSSLATCLVSLCLCGEFLCRYFGRSAAERGFITGIGDFGLWTLDFRL
jgi:hypothetical protein